jgi:cytosine/adenosine deaminase-related metal-dependent hydrolase
MIWRVHPERAIHAGLVVIGIATLAMGGTDSFSFWVALRLAAGLANMAHDEEAAYDFCEELARTPPMKDSTSTPLSPFPR